MQLFSIGLVMLNADGTPLLDANGTQVTTYDNDDIMDFSRVWTGFDEQPKRANIEDGGGENDVDPMQIKPAWRGASSVTDTILCDLASPSPSPSPTHVRRDTPRNTPKRMERWLSGGLPRPRVTILYT